MNVSEMGHYVCSLCNISFGELSVLHLHMGVHVEFVGPKDSLPSEIPETNSVSEDKKNSDGKEEYQCKVCHKFFSDRIFFSFHNLAHYEGKSFQCKICGSVFSSKSGVYNHVCSHISEKLCRCTRGHQSLQGKDDQPKIFESADDLLKCGVCDGGFSTKKRLENHIKKHKEHSCPICKISYNGPLDYEKHMRRHFQGSVHVFRCEICFETFCDKEERDYHMRIHQSSYSEELNLTGQTCVPRTTALKDGKSVNNLEDISEEKISKKLKSKHSQGSYQNFVPVCTVNDAPKNVGSCKKSDLRSLLKDIGISHGAMSGGSEKARSHSDGQSLVNTIEVDIKNLTASKSKKGYLVADGKDRSNNFNMKCGAGEEHTRYECKLCFNVLRDKHAFWHHLVEHSEDVPYTCKICVEIFDDADSWELHVKRKCGCALCGKLIKRVNYGHHNKVCPVSNPFKCLVCIKRFSSSDVFREHMKTHSREKSCRCKVCGEVLLLKYEVEKHNKMHGTESVDSVSASEDEEDPFSTISSAKTSSSHQVKSEQSLPNEYIPYEETDMKMPISSIKTECDVESSFLHTLDAIVVKEEPLFEEKKFFDDTGLTRNIEQNNLVIVTGEEDNSNLDESVVDPLA